MLAVSRSGPASPSPVGPTRDCRAAAACARSSLPSRPVTAASTSRACASTGAAPSAPAHGRPPIADRSQGQRVVASTGEALKVGASMDAGSTEAGSTDACPGATRGADHASTSIRARPWAASTHGPGVVSGADRAASSASAGSGAVRGEDSGPEADSGPRRGRVASAVAPGVVRPDAESPPSRYAARGVLSDGRDAEGDPESGPALGQALKGAARVAGQADQGGDLAGLPWARRRASAPGRRRPGSRGRQDRRRCAGPRRAAHAPPHRPPPHGIPCRPRRCRSRCAGPPWRARR
jgi:hypothetical protein